VEVASGDLASLARRYARDPKSSSGVAGYDWVGVGLRSHAEKSDDLLYSWAQVAMSELPVSAGEDASAGDAFALTVIASRAGSYRICST